LGMKIHCRLDVSFSFKRIVFPTKSIYHMEGWCMDFWHRMTSEASPILIGVRWLPMIYVNVL
jgi:hypothetical protein